MTIREIGDEEFEPTVLRASGVVIVDFWAEWCPPCRALRPVLEAIAGEHPEITIVGVDADENLISAATYRALSLPTMKVFRDGKLVQTLVGARPRAALEAALAAYLG